MLDSLEEQSRELSTRTVIFHHLIGERLGLNPTDHKCLDVVIRSGMPMTASQLAEETGLSTGAITGVVDSLEKAGYVRRKRDQNDRRLVFINPLLDKAMIKLGPICDPIKQASRSLYSKYSDEELAIIGLNLSLFVFIIAVNRAILTTGHSDKSLSLSRCQMGTRSMLVLLYKEMFARLY